MNREEHVQEAEHLIGEADRILYQIPPHGGDVKQVQTDIQSVIAASTLALAHLSLAQELS